jgi:hypothetical protein
MRKIKFAKPKIYRSMFTPGNLTFLAEEILSGKPVKDISRLTTNEMAQIPSLYSSFNPREQSILDLEDSKIYKTKNDDEVFGKDIKAITMLMYDKPRTAYWKPDKPQIYDTSVCGGVPLPMLGFKRFWNIKYDSWREYFEKAAYLNSEDEFNLVDSEGAIESAFKIDILLGKTFASTTYNAGTDEIEWNDKGYGLLLLSTAVGKGFRPNAEQLSYLRTKNMGNYKGTFANVYGTARVDNHRDIDKDIVLLHNKASQAMRLLMTQRWAWYSNHRNTDMICDFQDWNFIPKAHDTIDNVFTGLKPKSDTVNSGLGSHFKIGG